MGSFWFPFCCHTAHTFLSFTHILIVSSAWQSPQARAAWERCGFFLSPAYPASDIGQSLEFWRAAIILTGIFKHFFVLFSDGVCVSVCVFPSPFVCYVLGQSGHFTSNFPTKSSKLQVLFRLVFCREQRAIGSDSTEFLFHVPLICQHNCWEVFEQVIFHCIAVLKLHYFYTVSTEYRVSFGVFESLQWLKDVLSWEQSQVKNWRCVLFLWLNLWFFCQSVFQVFI